MSEPQTTRPDKVALVTGSAKRVGRYLASHLADRGYAIAVHYGRSSKEADDVVAELQARGVRAAAIGANLGDSQQAERLIAEVTHALGPVELLVNSASSLVYDEPRTFSADLFEMHMRVNALAPILLARDLADALPEGSTGCIVNMLDMRVVAPPPTFFTYALSKQVLDTATRLMALSLAPRVRVNAIAPGLTLPSGTQSEDEFAAIVNDVPLRVGSSLARLARALDYLIDAEAVTGQTLFVDGGDRLRAVVSDDPTTFKD